MVAPALAGEESPNTTRQHAAEKPRRIAAKAAVDGKCHREQTAMARLHGCHGKGEKAG